MGREGNGKSREAFLLKPGENGENFGRENFLKKDAGLVVSREKGKHILETRLELRRNQNFPRGCNTTTEVEEKTRGEQKEELK